MKSYSISNACCSGRLDLTKSLSLSVIAKKSGPLVQSHCNRIPVWTLCAVDSIGGPTKSDPFSYIICYIMYMQNNLQENAVAFRAVGDPLDGA